MDQGTLQGIGTILTMIAFLGICWWAYSGRKKKDFDEASQLPFADEQNEREDSQTKDNER
ncbi:cbb3-type cytochrome oxidase subunit 3 [Porticoccus litoralis]|jgi:cytochrome c oxidase cbb3-type subunit 4|uniref:Cbb3-type cytochrome c oxidase subunit 3 n=1 Tax=Porticoccus litoralis TaxID=434086 RepID=A0AAW8B1A2_9GAMM|nr:cbb3-type cytochrome c oxidase subunit 3 [Porticoccus litoralis]MDP1519564.1 cbb3-type cytochrome c oxidase subunit 3 [Porticoccus litoralis]